MERLLSISAASSSTEIMDRDTFRPSMDLTRILTLSPVLTTEVTESARPVVKAEMWTNPSISPATSEFNSEASNRTKAPKSTVEATVPSTNWAESNPADSKAENDGAVVATASAAAASLLALTGLFGGFFFFRGEQGKSDLILTFVNVHDSNFDFLSFFQEFRDFRDKSRRKVGNVKETIRAGTNVQKSTVVGDGLDLGTDGITDLEFAEGLALGSALLFQGRTSGTIGVVRFFFGLNAVEGFHFGGNFGVGVGVGHEEASASAASTGTGGRVGAGASSTSTSRRTCPTGLLNDRGLDTSHHTARNKGCGRKGGSRAHRKAESKCSHSEFHVDG